jgi:anthranilate phosphoribosyltransferase
VGIVFMFAPIMHPAMRHVGPVRRELGIPTLMNVLGPLANPAGAGRQVVGVAEPHRMPLLAGALAALGTVRALVVHGEPGLDEISPLGCTSVMEVRDGAVREWTIDPAEYGLAVTDSAELAGGSPRENARLIVNVLSGRLGGGPRAAVVLNAAAAVYVSGEETNFGDAVHRAQRALWEGAGMDALERLRESVRR